MSEEVSSPSEVSYLSLQPRLLDGESVTLASDAPDGDPRPDVSLVVAAYNAAPYIKASLLSATSQVGVTCEVIAVDDASTDETFEILRKMATSDPRIKILKRSENGGPAKARNEAIRLARGRWLAILDADDVIDPDRSSKLISLAEITAADAIADNYVRFGDSSIQKGSMIPDPGCPAAFAVDIASFIRGNAVFGSKSFTLGAIKPMFRTDFIRDTGCMFPEDLNYGEDYFFCLSALCAGASFVVTCEPLYHYRMRTDSLSFRLSEQQTRRILEAHQRCSLPPDPEIQTASLQYMNALQEALLFSRFHTLMKENKYFSALSLVAVHPNSWRLTARLTTEAVFKRIRRATRILGFR
jgi:succinoglycan biosynthesis protein ExoO